MGIATPDEQKQSANQSAKARGNANALMVRKKRLSLLIGALTMASSVLVFQNCSEYTPAQIQTLASESASSADNGLSGDGASPTQSTQEEFFKSAQDVLQRKCVQCHSSASGASGGQSLNLQLQSEAEFVAGGLVVPGDIAKSKLIFRLKNYPVGAASARTMPKTGDLTDGEYQILVNWVNRMSSDIGPFACENSDPKPAVSNAKRLSVLQYRQTLQDFLGRFMTAAEAKTLVDAELTKFQLPSDSTRYQRADNSFGAAHANSVMSIADELAKAVTSSPIYYSSLVKTMIGYNPGKCVYTDVNSLNPECQQQLIRNLGLRLLRRPLKEGTGNDEVQIYLSEFSGKGSASSAGVNDILFRLLLAPDFLFQLEVNERNFAADPTTLRLSSNSVANRLAYTFWNSMPDEKLLALAAAKDLGATSAFVEALNYVVDHPKLADGTSEFFNNWLKLDDTPQLDATSPAGKIFAGGTTIDATTRDEMIREVQELGSYTIANGGTFADLFTTDISFARSPAMMKIYGVTTPASLSVTPVNAIHLPKGTRAGLLTRAALLMDRSGGGATNPVIRGVRIREDILCMPVDPPPADIAAMVTAPDPDPSLTVREQFSLKTSPETCNGCHRAINPLGFALGNFNGFGFFQTAEPTFNTDGTPTGKSLAVDTKVDLGEIIGPGVVANDPAQMSQMIADRSEARVCFAKAFAEHTLLRPATVEKDGCRLNRLYKASARTSSLKDFAKSLALDPEFRLRKTE